MTINISLPEVGPNLRPTITVLGVGGAGGNAVNNMIRSNLEGVDFLIANTDAQALDNSICERKIQLGLQSTRGLGAGMRPDVGRQAAEEAIEEVKSKIEGSHMIFIAAGMGGGTGTGAAPIIAQLAREHGILTVGVITKPFHFEGTQRMKLAEEGIKELQQQVDTLITIPNQNLFRIANEKTTFSDAFKMADDILYAGVRGVTDLMVQPGLINLDFSDIKTVMSEMGKAMMGTAQSDSSENRAIEAAEKAIANPLIDDVSLKGARGLIINITGGSDLTLYEVDEAANRIKEEVKEDANIIYGTTCDERLEGIIRVSIVATGIDANISSNFNENEKSASLAIDNSIYQKKNLNQASLEITPIISPNSDVVRDHDLISSHDLDNKAKEANSSELHREETINANSNVNENNINLETESINDIELESTKDSELESANAMEEKIEDLLLSEENQEESNIAVETDNEEAIKDNNETVRKLSLFDTLNNQDKSEENSNVSSEENLISKNEPFLKNEDDLKEKSEEDINFDQIDSEEVSNEEINQDPDENEEELLDIPTFLRRQAN